MKKRLLVLFYLSGFVCTVYAAEINFGINYGKRQIRDVNLMDVYGDGYVFTPYLRYSLFKWVALEIAYEGGYKESGKVGIYREESTFVIKGWEICGILRYRVKRFVPYLKYGYGYYSYKQDIESEYNRLEVDHHKAAAVLGAGLHIFLLDGLFFSAEIKYVPLKVNPFGIEIDMGGMRYLAGLGFRFDL